LTEVLLQIVSQTLFFFGFSDVNDYATSGDSISVNSTAASHVNGRSV